MNNNIHNISKGKAPPVKRQRAKGKGQKLRSSYTFYFELFTFSLTSGQLLLNMRDGPRGRAPAIRFAMGNGLVTLNQKSSVSLCVHSASSAVKKFLPQRKQRSHREHRVIYTLNPTKTFRMNCTEDGRLQEEKSGLEEWNIGVLEYWNDEC